MSSLGLAMSDSVPGRPYVCYLKLQIQGEADAKPVGRDIPIKPLVEENEAG